MVKECREREKARQAEIESLTIENNNMKNKIIELSGKVAALESNLSRVECELQQFKDRLRSCLSQIG